jgi:hypothetical protein
MHDDSRSNRGSASVARAIRVAVVTLCLPVHGCEPVNGGAVELSWKLRPASSALNEKFVDCQWATPETAVAKIRLHWEVTNNSADSRGKIGSQAWDCGFSHGVTGFDLAEGVASLWVTPECVCPPGEDCPEGVPPAIGTYIAPAIVRRTVIRGDTVSLGAVELVVAVSDCNSAPCICAR